VLWFTRLFACLFPRRPWFCPSPIHVGFVVVRLAPGQVSVQVFPFSSVGIIPPMLRTHSFIYHRRCIMFFSQYSSFPCQYHSTNAPHSYIHLPPTLYNVFLPVLQFPVSIIPPMLHTHSSIYHRRCIMFFSQYSSFPCQYHSTNAPYSFIHLPLTLYNVFLPVLSLHHCCIFIFVYMLLVSEGR
jgi:hypothetical protein